MHRANSPYVASVSKFSYKGPVAGDVWDVSYTNSCNYKQCGLYLFQWSRWAWFLHQINRSHYSRIHTWKDVLFSNLDVGTHSTHHLPLSQRWKFYKYCRWLRCRWFWHKFLWLQMKGVLFPAVAHLCRNIVFCTPSLYIYTAAPAVYNLCPPIFQLCLAL